MAEDKKRRAVEVSEIYAEPEPSTIIFTVLQLYVGVISTIILLQLLLQLGGRLQAPLAVVPANIINAKSVAVTEDRYEEVALEGDIFVLTADSDIFFTNNTNYSFPLWANSYVIMWLKNTDKIYIRSLSGTATAYIMFLKMAGG
jgi:hypothetical protein